MQVTQLRYVIVTNIYQILSKIDGNLEESDYRNKGKYYLPHYKIGFI